VSQDFQATFGLGADELHIASLDADGVALVAIQGLYQQTLAQQEQIQAQDARIQAQQRALQVQDARILSQQQALHAQDVRIQALEAQVAALVDQLSALAAQRAGGGQ
jgi:hypothetical protein